MLSNWCLQVAIQGYSQLFQLVSMNRPNWMKQVGTTHSFACPPTIASDVGSEGPHMLILFISYRVQDMNPPAEQGTQARSFYTRLATKV